MANIENLFSGAFVPPKPAAPESLENQFIKVIDERYQHELAASDILANGEIQRFKVGSGNNKNGWYVLFHDNNYIGGGAFGDWREGDQHNFIADSGRNMSAVEQMAHADRMARIRKARQEVSERKHSAVSSVTQAVWDQAKPADMGHEYLSRKRVQSHGARIASDGRLLLPMYDSDGNISSVQYIAVDGSKMFHKGGKVAGCFYVIGDINSSKSVCIAEGFATAASVYEATGFASVVAFSASNIPATAKAMRQQLGGHADIVVVADNNENGVGERYAKEAADATGCRYVMPPDVDTDANDLAVSGGDVAGLITPQADDFLVHVSDFVQQPAPIQWLVKGWLQRNALMMLFGPSGSGKSFIAIDWACRIAGGAEDWNGCQVRGGGTVVYLAGEGHHGMRARVRGWMDENNVKDLDMYVSQHGVDLNTSQGYTKVARSMSASNLKPSLIVVDTLHRFLQGDENSAEDARGMIDACNGLMREFNCSVMLVHHTGVSPEAQKRGRGSSAWKGALDIEIRVSGDTITQTKTKDSEPMSDVGYNLISTPVAGWIDEDGDQVTTALVKLCEPAERISNKKDPLHETKKMIEDVFTKTGYEFSDNGLPFVGRKALERYLIDGGKSERTAKSYARQGGHRDGALLDEGWLIEYRHGFCIVDPASAQRLTLIKSDIDK